MLCRSNLTFRRLSSSSSKKNRLRLKRWNKQIDPQAIIGDKKVFAIMGAQWGDEGKGKLVDVLGNKFDITARCAGGSNAGHTVVVGNKKYAFHLMPSGILHENNTSFIGNGVVLHVPSFFKEIKNLEDQSINYDNRIKVSDRAHLLFDLHQQIDGLQEDAKSDKAKIGTTKKGIGPCYTSKVGRIGIRVGDLAYPDSFEDKFRSLIDSYKTTYPDLKVDIEDELKKYQDYYSKLKPFIVDGVEFIHTALHEGNRIMIEGANATMLDIDFGTYPYVTSSNASIGGAITGLGIPPNSIDKVIGIAKAYVTRVGAGPFPTELNDEIGEKLRKNGHEYGTTTGRPRRCGWLDLVQLKYVSKINGFHYINLTKLDVLSGVDVIKVAVSYKYQGNELNSFPSSLDVLNNVKVEYEEFEGWNEDISKARTMDDLPKQAVKYIKRIEQELGIPIKWIGVGPSRDDMVTR